MICPKCSLELKKIKYRGMTKYTHYLARETKACRLLPEPEKKKKQRVSD